ncbi:unnamed protein product [Protopolystoma xenopodis]|uniref:protein-tyrosine-phosphatase n=1 Tax=Protopolystoma xenopodis TaxID=117903 RepID=A0A3S5AJJ0_9PLAT|nr:unnamed protein product [Protopolystoma xenopodis]
MAGVSRSAAVVMAYLLRHSSRLTVLEALDFVQTRRPVAGPNLHFMGQLEHFHQDLTAARARRVGPGSSV